MEQHTANLQTNCHTGKIKIDTLQVWIPITAIQANRSALNKFVQSVDKDGELCSTLTKKNALKIEHKGVVINYRIIEPLDENQKNEIPHLVIYLGAKMLKQKYFEGLTEENTETEVYNFLQEIPFGIEFTKEEFMKARVTDIDYCYDLEMSDTDLKWLCDIIEERTKETRKQLIHRYNRKENETGMSFHRDRRSSTPKSPHIKIYHKGKEVDAKKETFAELPEGMKIVRLEVTMKNKKHWSENSLQKPETLQEALRDQKQMTNFVLSAIDKMYIDRQHKHMKKKNDQLTPTQSAMLTLMEELTAKGKDEKWFKTKIATDYVYRTGVEWTDERVYRLKKLIKKLLSEMPEEQTAKMNSNTEVNKVLKLLGMDPE